MGGEGADDLSNRQQMKRTVKQRERCPLARGIQRGARRKCLAALNVRGGQCPKRTGDFGHAEVREVAGFERSQPCRKPVILRQQTHGVRHSDRLARFREVDLLS